MPKFKIVVRKILIEHRIIEAEDEEAAEMLDGDDETISADVEDEEVLSVVAVNSKGEKMAKCLVATDGREFQVFICDYTEEQRLDLENSGFFDGITEYELVEEQVGPDGRFMLMSNTPTGLEDTGMELPKAKIVPFDELLFTKPVEGGFDMVASGGVEDIVREVDALQELIDQGN